MATGVITVKLDDAQMKYIREEFIEVAERLRKENAELRARVAELEARDDSVKLVEDMRGMKWITDGFGNSWAAFCKYCGAPMVVLSPGFARCSKECYIKDVPDANT